MAIMDIGELAREMYPDTNIISSAYFQAANAVDYTSPWFNMAVILVVCIGLSGWVIWCGIAGYMIGQWWHRRGG